jgi:hypothetical protein
MGTGSTRRWSDLSKRIEMSYQDGSRVVDVGIRGGGLPQRWTRIRRIDRESRWRGIPCLNPLGQWMGPMLGRLSADYLARAWVVEPVPHHVIHIAGGSPTTKPRLIRRSVALPKTSRMLCRHWQVSGIHGRREVASVRRVPYVAPCLTSSHGRHVLCVP